MRVEADDGSIQAHSPEPKMEHAVPRLCTEVFRGVRTPDKPLPVRKPPQTIASSDGDPKVCLPIISIAISPLTPEAILTYSSLENCQDSSSIR